MVSAHIKKFVRLIKISERHFYWSKNNQKYFKCSKIIICWKNNFKKFQIGFEALSLLKTWSPPSQKIPNFIFCSKRCEMFWSVCKINCSIFLHFFVQQNFNFKFLGFLRTWFRNVNQWYPITSLLVGFSMAGMGGETPRTRFSAEVLLKQKLFF